MAEGQFYPSTDQTREQLHEALARTALLLRLDAFPGLGSHRDGELVDALRATGIRIVADRVNLASPNGQTTLVTLVCQCAMLGLRVDLDLPDVPQVIPQPPLNVNLPLGSALVAWMDDLFPGCLSSVAVPLLTFAIGDTPTLRSPGGRRAGGVVHVSGADHSMFLASDHTHVTRWRGTQPWGPIAAAAAGAAEALRAAIPSVTAMLDQPAPVEINWRPRQFTSIRVDLPTTSTRATRLGPVDLISAGAITQAALYALLRVPGFDADLRTIDRDVLARSNSNRYALVRASDLDRPKVEQLADFSTDSVRIRGVQHRLDQDTISDLNHLAPRVIVGVDDIPTRWFVQRQQPSWVGIGATSHGFVLVSDHLPGHPCGGCVHPRDDDNPVEEIPTIGFVSLWAGLLLAGTLLAPDASSRSGTRRIEMHPMGLYGPDGMKLLPQARNVSCPVCGVQTSAA
jgi:hypothetical protein